MQSGNIIPVNPRTVPTFYSRGAVLAFLRAAPRVEVDIKGLRRSVSGAELAAHFSRVVQRLKAGEKLPPWGGWVLSHFYRAIYLQMGRSRVVLSSRLIAGISALSRAESMMDARSPFTTTELEEDVKRHRARKFALRQQGYTRRSQGLARAAATKSRKGVL